MHPVNFGLLVIAVPKVCNNHNGTDWIWVDLLNAKKSPPSWAASYGAATDSIFHTDI